LRAGFFAAVFFAAGFFVAVFLFAAAFRAELFFATRFFATVFFAAVLRAAVFFAAGRRAGAPGDRALVFRFFEPEDELAEPAFFLLAILTSHRVSPWTGGSSPNHWTGVRAGPRSAAGGRKGARL
jgi:hypothetical protein